MTDTSVEPLPSGQQLLLQRLMAAHVLCDEDVKELFDKIVEDGNNATQTQSQEDDDDDEPQQNKGPVMGDATTLEEAFCSINAQLMPGFGLEIVTMIDVDGESGDGDESSIKYHAVVNSHNADDISKEAFLKAYNPHERAFVRKLLEKMIGAGDNNDDNDNEDYALKRKDCINLRSELEGGFKLDVNQAERMVQILLEEQWLRISARQDYDNDDNDDDNDDDQAPAKKKRRRRRESVQNKLELAPRLFMEMSHYLESLGMPTDDLPQIIQHLE